MARVKMAAKQEYEYLANFKILQNAFSKHKIDKVCHSLCRAPPSLIKHSQPIPVEKLVKCKMQYVDARSRS